MRAGGLSTSHFMRVAPDQLCVMPYIFDIPGRAILGKSALLKKLLFANPRTDARFNRKGVFRARPQIFALRIIRRFGGMLERTGSDKVIGPGLR